MTDTNEVNGGADPEPLDEIDFTPTDHVTGWFERHRFMILIVLLLLAFTFIVFSNRFIKTIHAGEEGVRWSRFSGTVTDKVFLDGLQLIFPWDELYIYDVRLQSVDHAVEILSTDGLEIKVFVSIRYRPLAKAVPHLHQQVGPDYVNRIVIPEVVAAVREVMGRYRPEQLYTLRTDEMRTQILQRAVTQVRDRFVMIDDVLMRRIELPASVQAAIQRKLAGEQEALEYVFRLQKETKEADRKRTEAAGIRDFQLIVRQGINADLLKWKGIEATLELAKSPNAKVIIVGGRDGLPLILNANQ